MAFCLRGGSWHLRQLGGLGFLNLTPKRACALKQNLHFSTYMRTNLWLRDFIGTLDTFDGFKKS